MTDRTTPQSDSEQHQPGSTQYVRRVESTERHGDVTLVGVVHDHPASSYRVQRHIEAVSPDIVALELPEMAVALPAARARDAETPPRHGGEMSAAIQAASGNVVGIDAPSVGYLRRLLRYCVRESVPLGTVAGVLSDFGRSVGQALKWRVGATVERRLGIEADIGRGDDHDVSHSDPVDDLIESEARHVSISQTFRAAVSTPAALDIVDTVREATMAGKLTALSTQGDVIAVVGFSHLDPIADRLER